MSDPLLVPMHVDAMVLNRDASVSTPFLRFEPDYDALRSFEAVGPAPFGGGSSAPPAAGVYLHWTLPRPLRHGRQHEGGATQFPFVPNRWVIVRVQAAITPDRAVKAWILASDAVHDDAQAGSAFVSPAGLDADGLPEIVRIGRSQRLDAAKLTSPAAPFLQAVGPGSATFAMFAPAVNDVFSFFDDVTDLDDTTTLAAGSFTYHVAGWYSDPAFDPLAKARWSAAGANGPAGASIDDTLGFLAFLDGRPPPTSMLVHALVSAVPWDRAADNPPAPSYPTNIQTSVRVAVGNSAIDALSAIVRLERGSQAEADLLEAFHYGLLEHFDAPGAAERLADDIRRQWYGASPGGIGWTVVAAERNAQTASAAPAPARLSTAQQIALAKLNRSQRECDRLSRILEAMRWRLYSLWWKAGWLNANPSAPFKKTDWMAQQLAVQLGTSTAAAGGWPPYIDQVGDQNTTVAAAQAQVQKDRAALSGMLDPTQMTLKSVTLPEFHTPNDPVVLVTGLGRSTNLDPVGDLTCRLPSQTIDTLTVDGKTGSGPLLADPLALLPAGVRELHAESFLLSPALYARDVLGDAAKAADVRKALAALPAPAPSARFAPASGSFDEWVQPWVPLFMDWQVTVLKAPAYKPGSGANAPAFTLDASNWGFDGTDHGWVGPTAAHGDDFSAPDSGQMTLRGRTFLTPQLNFTLAAQLDEWIHKHSVRDPKIAALLDDLEKYLDAIRGQDVLSQRLSGLRALLIQRDGSATVPATGRVADELGQQPQRGFPRPFPDEVAAPVWDFAPLAGTFFTLDRLTVIDFMGRTIDLTLANWSQNPQTGSTSGEWFFPIAAPGVRAPTAKDPSPTRGRASDATERMLQLSPRFTQDAQLALRLTSNDGSNVDVDLAASANPICGWVVPNHLDRSVAVYAPDGRAWGELFLSRHAGGAFVPHWQPDPTDPHAPQSVATIENAYVRAMLTTLCARADEGAGFSALLQAIDETLWTVDPGGAGKDEDLSVLVGRPLAVVRGELWLRLRGLAPDAQDWLTTFADMSGPADVPAALGGVDGGVTDDLWPVRLGSRAVRSDGLIGYFVDDAFDTFHAVHVPEDAETPYLHQIGSGGDYLRVRAIDDTATAPDPAHDELRRLTMLVDPRGSVRAYSGLLPVTSVALQPAFVKPALQRMAYLFRAGPLLTPPGEIRMPRPAATAGTWSWFDRVLGVDVPLTPADANVQLSSTPPIAREGWLKLTPNPPLKDG